MQRKKTLSEEQYSSETRKSHFFCCCCCRSNSREEVKSKGLSAPNDRYEYIIEKLAIKRVPLSSFATEEDLLGSEVSSMSYVRKPKLHDDPSRRPNLAYSSYPASVSPSSSKPFSQIATGKFEDSSNKGRMATQEPRFIPQQQMEVTGHPHLDFMNMMGKIADQHVHRRARFSDEPKKMVQEKEMVSHILHNFSSLYTLDDEKAIPKDPETFKNTERHTSKPKPLAKQIMPQLPINIFKPQKKLVYAQVHKTSKQLVEDNPRMTQEIRDTINALGSAQPPLNMNPKPKVRLKRPPIISPEEENPDSFNELVEEESRELRCIALDKDVELVLHKCCDETHYHHDHPHEPPRAILPKPQSPTQFVPQRHQRQPIHRPPPRVLNVIPMKNSFENDSLEDVQEAESLPIVLEEESNVAVLPSQFSFGDVCTSTDIQNSRKQDYRRTPNKIFAPKVDMSEQLNNHCNDDPIMEINHVKGQNLKWKIIIKHHDDEEDTN